MVSAIDKFSIIQSDTGTSVIMTDETTKTATTAPTPSEHIITARRTRDGSLMFDVRISHIIEQTLLRAFNRPNFRKSTIRVVDDSDDEESDSTSTDNNNDPEYRKAMSHSLGEVSDDSVDTPNPRSLVPVSITKKRKRSDSGNSNTDTICMRSEESQTEGNLSHIDDDEDINQLSKEAEDFLKKPCWNVSRKSDTIIENVSPIPTSWLQRGISSEEKLQFEQSIANASLCPYQRKRKLQTIKQEVPEPTSFPLQDTYGEDYSEDPFSTAEESNIEAGPFTPPAVDPPRVSSLYIPRSAVGNTPVPRLREGFSEQTPIRELEITDFTETGSVRDQLGLDDSFDKPFDEYATIYSTTSSPSSSDLADQ